MSEEVTVIREDRIVGIELKTGDCVRLVAKIILAMVIVVAPIWLRTWAIFLGTELAESYEGKPSEHEALQNL